MQNFDSTTKLHTDCRNFIAIGNAEKVMPFYLMMYLLFIPGTNLFCSIVAWHTFTTKFHNKLWSANFNLPSQLDTNHSFSLKAYGTSHRFTYVMVSDAYTNESYFHIFNMSNIPFLRYSPVYTTNIYNRNF